MCRIAVRRMNPEYGGGRVKKLLLTLAVLTAVLAGVVTSPAQAVKFGDPDFQNQYPWVGLMAAIDPAGEPLWRCTGSPSRKPICS